MENTAEYWIEKLGLQAHPEGGYFKEVYRSEEEISQAALLGRFNGNRSFSTFFITALIFGSLHQGKEQ